MLPPAVALLVVGTWLGLQRRAISTTELDCATLRDHLAAEPGAAPSPAKAAAPNKTTKAGAPINWKTFAGQFDEMERAGATADMRLMLRFQQRLQSMTREELIAGLDAIPALGLSTQSRSMLEQTLIGPLIEKDPEYVLRHFIDALQDDASGLKWHLPTALRDWAKQDPAKADAWLDEQIAAGKFDSKTLDGKNPCRAQFEGVMLGILLTADPAAAGRRLGAMPEDQRADIIGNDLINSVTAETQAAFTKLVRDQVPAADRPGIFAIQAAQCAVQGGYSKVTEYLAQIDATPAERSTCVERAASIRIFANNRLVTSEDLDTLRTWAGAQAPDTTDRVTGNILATATQMTPALAFNAAAELAVQYSQASGNDDVLATFLGTWTARNNKEQARVFAEKIVDETRREEILKRLNH